MSMKPEPIQGVNLGYVVELTSVTSRIPTRSIERRELCSTRGVRSMPSRVNRGRHRSFRRSSGPPTSPNASGDTGISPRRSIRSGPRRPEIPRSSLKRTG